MPGNCIEDGSEGPRGITVELSMNSPNEFGKCELVGNIVLVPDREVVTIELEGELVELAGSS